MLEIYQNASEHALNPDLFMWGLGEIYLTGLILLIAVVAKFREHARNKQSLESDQKHPFSTREMLICVLLLFPFWVNNVGQFTVEDSLQTAYFATGSIMIFLAIAWHIAAKLHIRFMWSDGIEIKSSHHLVTTGAYALARHPMYASLLLWCWGASLVMFNWATFALVSVVFLPLIVMRARAEEKALSSTLPDYVLYQRNVRMLTPTLQGTAALLTRIVLLVLFAYYVWEGVTLSSLLLMAALHLYAGYSLTPEKVAFSYRSKAGLMVVFWGLSLFWPPAYYLFYLMLAMLLYGLKFDCPCMMLYDKFHGCPCFFLIKKCMVRR